MPERRRPDWAVSALSVILALIVWVFVTWERPAERKFTVPVRLVNLPAGMSARGIPQHVEVTISGPRLQVLFLNPDTLAVDLDLAAAQEGSLSYPGMEHQLRLPDDLTVVRISPARVEVRLEKNR